MTDLTLAVLSDVPFSRPGCANARLWEGTRLKEYITMDAIKLMADAIRAERAAKEKAAAAEAARNNRIATVKETAQAVDPTASPEEPEVQQDPEPAPEPETGEDTTPKE